MRYYAGRRRQTTAEFAERVVSYIARFGPMSATQVAACFGPDGGRVQHALKALRAAGRVRNAGKSGAHLLIEALR